MNKNTYIIIISCMLIFFTISQITATQSSIQLTGSYECITTLYDLKSFNGKTNDQQFSWGMNNFINLRMKSNISSYLDFQLAFNLNMLSGSMTDFYKLYYLTDAASIISRIPVGPDKTLLTDPDTVKTGFFSIPFFYRTTYIGGIELERFYFRLKFEYATLSTGLQRYARGYGQAFSPNDFFNPRNAANLDARPVGKLSFISTFYPSDMWTIDMFAVAPDDPLETQGKGFKFGIATDILNIIPEGTSFSFNFQFLYTLFTPEQDFTNDPDLLKTTERYSSNFSHIAGFAFRADIEVGIFVDTIYRFDHRNFITGEYFGRKFYGYEGLEFAIGIDYTTAAGYLYFLIEYLFYGPGMLEFGENSLDTIYLTGSGVENWETLSPIKRTSNPVKKRLYYARHNYVYCMLMVKINDFFNFGNSFLFGPEDQSGIITTFFNINPIQNLSIGISALVPLDKNLFNNSFEAGEFGPLNIGFYNGYKINISFKF